MKHTRQTTVVLAAILLLSALASCKDTDNGNQTTNPVDSTPVTMEALVHQTQPAYQMNLPEDLDFGGEEVFIYGWEHYEDIEFFAEAEIGEIVNDAVYRRNLAVKENLNISLAFSEIDGRGGGEWERKVSNANMAGDAAYDIVAGHSHRIGTLTKTQDLLNLLDYDYLDLDQPWWRSELTERALIREKLYFVTGDISPSSVARSQGIFFNMDILNSFDLENPYQLVLDGTWTHSKMMEMSRGISRTSIQMDMQMKQVTASVLPLTAFSCRRSV